jgi:hypothetical protein
MLLSLLLLFALSDEIPAPPADVQPTAEGLITQKLADGTGTEHPRPGDLLLVRYTVWRPDGRSIASTRRARRR